MRKNAGVLLRKVHGAMAAPVIHTFERAAVRRDWSAVRYVHHALSNLVQPRFAS